MCFENIHLDRPVRDLFRSKLDRFFDYIPGISLINNLVNAIQLRRFKGKEDVSLFQQYLRHKTVKHCALYMFPLAKVIHNIWKKAKGVETEKFAFPEENEMPPMHDMDAIPRPVEAEPPRAPRLDDRWIRNEEEWIRRLASSQLPQQNQETPAGDWVYEGLTTGRRFIFEDALDLTPEPMPPQDTLEAEKVHPTTPLQDFDREEIDAKLRDLQKSVENTLRRWELVKQDHEIVSQIHKALQSPETFFINPQDPITVQFKVVFDKTLKNAMNEFEASYEQFLGLLPEVELRVNNSSTLAEVAAEEIRYLRLSPQTRSCYGSYVGVHAAIESLGPPMPKEFKDNIIHDVQVLMGQFMVRYQVMAAERWNLTISLN